MTTLRLIAFSGAADCEKYPKEIGPAHGDDDPGEYRRVLEPLARRGTRRHGQRLDLLLVQPDSQITRGASPSGRRRGQPHDQGHDDRFDPDRNEALPEEDGVAERDDALRHDTAVRDDVANRRLKRARRGHLQRRRSAESLRPDAAETQEAGGSKRAIIDALLASCDLARQHRAENQAEPPVQPRAGQCEHRHHRYRGFGRARPRRQHANQTANRRGCREDMAGDDDERHLEREWNQLPESASPRVNDLPGRRRRRHGTRDHDDDGTHQGEDERIRHPPLRPGRERQGHASDDAGSFERCSGGCRLAEGH